MRFASIPLVRSATDRDIEAVRGLLGGLSETTYAPLIGAAVAAAAHERWHSRDALRSQLSSPNSSFLVAQDNSGLIVGHAFAMSRCQLNLTLMRLYVAVSHQRRGVGQRLLAEVLAQHPAAERVRLFVLRGNSGALAFYGKLGFAETGEAEEDGIVSRRLERTLA